MKYVALANEKVDKGYSLKTQLRFGEFISKYYPYKSPQVILIPFIKKLMM